MSILMLLPLLGGAFFLRRVIYLCDSFSILISVSCFLLLTYLGGLFGIIQPLVYVLTGFGLLLLLWEIHRIFKEKIISFSFPLFLFLFLPIVYWIVHKESKPMLWDEYSHWGIYIREMAMTHEFYTGDTIASHPDYPPGVALWQYYFTLIPGYSEGAIYLSQFVLLITPLLILFENIRLKQWLWIPVILTFLTIVLANFSLGIVSLYTDHLLSVWYVGVVLQTIRPGKKNQWEMNLLSLPLSVILLIKDAGLLLVSSAIILIFSQMIYKSICESKSIVFKRKMLITLILLFAIPFSIQSSWKFNRSLQGISSQNEGTGLIQILRTEKSDFSHGQMKIYREHFWEVLSDQQISRNDISWSYNEFSYDLMPNFKDSYRLTIVGLFLIFPLWSMFIVFFTEKPKKYEYALALLIMYLTALSYFVIIFLTYPLIHTFESAKNLKSIFRYAYTIILPMYILGIGLLLPIFQNSSKQNRTGLFSYWNIFVFGLILLLFWIFEKPFLKHFYSEQSFKNHPTSYAFEWRNSTDKIIEIIKKEIGLSKIWIYMPYTPKMISSKNISNIIGIDKNQFQSAILRYQFSPIKSTINNESKLFSNSPKYLKEIWSHYDYIWFPVRNFKNDLVLEKIFGKKSSSLLKVIKKKKDINVEAVQFRFRSK